MTTKYRSNIWKMYLVKFFYYMHFIAAVLVPFFTEWGKISFSQVLVLNAAFMFFIFLLEVPTGTIADFFGRKISIILAIVCNMFAVMIYLSHPGFYVFLAGEFVWALSATLMSGADEAFIYDSLKELDKTKISKKIFSRSESFKLAGILVGCLLGSSLAKFFGVKAPVLFMTVPFGIAAVIALTLKEPACNQEEKDKESYSALIASGFKFFSNHKILRVLAFDMIGVSAMTWLIIWFYQKILMNMNVDLVYFGAIHAMMCVAQIVVIQSSGKFEKLLRKKKNLLLLGALIPGTCFILIGTVSYIPLVVLSIILAAGFGLSRRPLFASYMNKFIPSDKRATILSVTSMFRTFAICITNLIAAALAEWSISYTMVIFGILLFLFIGITRVQEEHLID